MKRVLHLAFLGVLAAGPSFGQGIPIDGNAAIVNEKVITIGDVIDKVTPWEEELRKRFSGRELQKQLELAFEKGLNLLIEQSLILEEYKNEKNQIPDKMIDDQIEKTIAEKFGGNRNAFLQWVEDEKRSSVEEYKKDVRERIIFSLLSRREVREKVQVSPTAVRKLYEQEKERLVVPEEVKLRMIVINRDGGANPETVRARLEAGENFGALAKNVSVGSRASTGGDWGWVKPKDFRKELKEAINRLQGSELSPVLTIGEQFYLLKLEERRDGGIIPFEQIKDRIELQVRAKEEARLHKAWTERLKQKHYVRIYDAM